MANTRDNNSVNIDNIVVSTAYHCDTDTCNSIIGNSKPSLRIAVQNIRSIYKNLDNLQAQLATLTCDIDIIILTECWLSEHKQIPGMENYKTFSTKTCLNKSDGIVIYVKTHLQCVMEEPEPVGANFIILKIHPDIVILAVYRSPSLRCTDTFLYSLENIIKPLKTSKLVLAGDINIDIKPNNNDRNSASYLNLTAELGLLPGHTYPTRINNCLDHVMINTPGLATILVTDSTVTDHALILLNLAYKYQPSNTVKYVRSIDYPAALEYLKSIDFSFINLNADVNVATSQFVQTLSSVIATHSKVNRVPSRKRVLKPWITPGLLKCIRHRDKLHKKALNEPNNDIVQISYKRYRNHCNCLLRKLKINYEKSLLNTSKNTKETWNAVKTIINLKNQKTSADNLITTVGKDSKSIDDLNNYFSNVGKELADQIILSGGDIQPSPYKFDVPSTINSMVLLPPEESEVESLIMNLKNNCATGWDSIPATFLKLAKTIIVPPITQLMKMSFAQGIFPQDFKKSLITPVHKGGNQTDYKNYRPISVLTSMSKILEKLLNNRLKKFLEQNQILSEAQYGFRSGRSTEDAVNHLIDFVTSKVDAKQKCLGVFLDLAKAFDTVCISTLVDRLERAGIRGNALNIFKDYLSNRTQRVKIGDHTSAEAQVTYGVPQGSVLAPTLFLIYINGLCQLSLINAKIFSYADDTALIFHGDTWEEVQKYAEMGLHKIKCWLEANLLTLNLTKTTFMQFSIAPTVPPEINIKVHSCRFPRSNITHCSCMLLKKSSSTKYLGVLVDSKLNWRPHIELTTSRTRKLIWAFKKLRHVADLKLIRTVYYALAQSILGYCITAWGGACKTFMIHLERAQRSLLKVMTCKPYRYPTVALYKECEVLTVRQLYLLKIVIQQHRVTPYNVHATRKRTITNVCPSVKLNSASARRQHLYLAGFVYNKVNKLLNINSLTQNHLKNKIKIWLQSLDYEYTEKILQ